MVFQKFIEIREGLVLGDQSGLVQQNWSKGEEMMGLAEWIGSRALYHSKGKRAEPVGQQGKSGMKYFIKF